MTPEILDTTMIADHPIEMTGDIMMIEKIGIETVIEMIIGVGLEIMKEGGLDQERGVDTSSQRRTQEIEETEIQGTLGIQNVTLIPVLRITGRHQRARNTFIQIGLLYYL